MGTSWHFRELERFPQHVLVRLYAGPDYQHRASAGLLTLRLEEWADLQLLLRDFPPETVEIDGERGLE